MRSTQNELTEESIENIKWWGYTKDLWPTEQNLSLSAKISNSALDYLLFSAEKLDREPTKPYSNPMQSAIAGTKSKIYPVFN